MYFEYVDMKENIWDDFQRANIIRLNQIEPKIQQRQGLAASVRTLYLMHSGYEQFLQGLRNRLSTTAVHVLTVKPGFVDTPMTEGLDGLFLVASPERVATDIVRAYESRRDVLYTPWFWRYIMLAVRLIPERLFKKLKL